MVEEVDMEENIYAMLSQIAETARTIVPDGPVQQALSVMAVALDAGAALARAGSHDPAGQIERILSDDAMIARARDDRESALRAKFEEDE
jgi:hypothetical protein